jgi:hypothetical protein
MFRIMLKLPDLTLTFKNVEAGEFLKFHNEGMEFLEIFFTSPTSNANAT